MGQDPRHWDEKYGGDVSEDTLSWYQAHAGLSLEIIASTGVGPQANIIDVGGGLSVLTAELLQRGPCRPWLLDISAVALATARARLGRNADRVRFVNADVTRADLPDAYFDIWHDRAVFHFLTDPADRQRYVSRALRSVKPGGYLSIATFAKDGPERCSGLPVSRYDAVTLSACFAKGATLRRTDLEQHRTPAGNTQSFVYCLMQRNN